jgi:hypothetical protein
MLVRIRQPESQLNLAVPDDCDLATLKQLVANETFVSIETQVLIFGGKILSGDEATLVDLGMFVCQ